MIGKLKGILDTIAFDHVIIDAGGVGYVVFCSANTLRQLPLEGEAATLIIETHVREDHIHLYGFATEQERKAFRTLLKVSGVGAKMGLALLGTLTPAQLAIAIVGQDKKALTQVSGVGPKLAARILTELKDAFGGEEYLSGSVSLSSPSQNGKSQEAVGSDLRNIADAVSALVNLGYARDKAHTVICQIAGNDNEQTIAVGELIRRGLKELGRA
ncbi:MAG: ruvA [Rickettsiales bacterium]|jgi:Holliday junction DNA helicase RuvA|nr:ruvA [Rickettsiales bacterium]